MADIRQGYGILQGLGVDISKIPPEKVWEEVNKLQGTKAEKDKLKEHGIKKTFKMSNAMKEYYKEHFKDYNPVMLSIEKLVEDNDLLENKALENRRSEIWGKSLKDYKINEDKLKYEETYPILVTIRNVKYLIEDGMHRIRAMYNEGYDEAEILTRKE